MPATKKLLILGATGSTGQHLVKQALEAGHHVTALARTADKMTIRHDRLRTVAADVTEDATTLRAAVRDQDTVVSALGRGMSFKSTNLIQRSVPSICAAMEGEGVRRLIFLSAIGVGESIRDTPFLARVFMRLLLSDIYADKNAGEALIRKSRLDWTLVQPPQLTDGPLIGTCRAGERLALRGMPRMSRADVAHFIVCQMDNPEYVRKAILIAY